MFEQTFVTASKTRPIGNAIMAMIAEGIAIGVLLLIPLIYVQTLPNLQMSEVLLAPPPAAAPARTVQVRHRLFDPTKLYAPATVPKRVAAIVEPPPPPAAAAATPRRIEVGGAVQAARIVHEVVPRYPAVAKGAHIMGTVRFKAVIAADGTVKDLKLLDGNPLLVEAARNAVKQWVYKPTILNGRPVEIGTEIDMHFTLA